MRCFISIDVPDEIKKKLIAAGQRLLGRGVTLVKADALHITLLFLGEISDVEIGYAKSALDSIKWERFTVDVYGIDYFTPNALRVVYAKIGQGATELKDLHDAILRELSKTISGLKRENFVPHLTIARVKPTADRRELLAHISQIESLHFGSFEARGVSLKSSILTPDGPLYKDLYKTDF
ncbi:MAG: RNA 2',3'-cyclic phosphodiesterase [Candidatus Micrarchaeia archaeon]